MVLREYTIISQVEVWNYVFFGLIFGLGLSPVHLTRV